MANPPMSDPTNLSASQALRELVNPSSDRSAGQIVKSTADWKKAARAGTRDKKAMDKRLVPVHSALVRQKVNAAEHMKAYEAQLRKAKDAAKAGAGKEWGQVKKATAPTLAKDKGAIKKALTADKKAAAQALAPARSVLVRQKVNASANLKAYQAQLRKAKDAAKAGAGKEWGQAKKATAPTLAKDKAALAKVLGADKKALGVDKKSAIKALAPARSALVRVKQAGGTDVKAARSIIGQSAGNAKQNMAGLRGALNQSAAGDEARKAKGWAKTAKKTPLGRLLAGGG